MALAIQLLSYFRGMNMKGIGWAIALVLVGVLFFLNSNDVELAAQDSFSATPIGNSGFALSSSIRLNNPNLLSATIKTIEEKFYVNGTLVGTLNVAPEQGIPGRKETTLPVSVRFSRTDIKQFLADSAVGSKKAIITVTGKIDFTTMFGKGTINVNHTDSTQAPL